MRRVIFHIGMPKTGTTSIQAALNDQPPSVCTALTPFSQSRRPMPLLERLLPDVAAANAGNSDVIWLKNALAQGHGAPLIFSDEWLFMHQRLTAHLGDVLAPYSVAPLIVAYLRDMRPLMISKIQQWSRSPHWAVNFFQRALTRFGPDLQLRDPRLFDLLFPNYRALQTWQAQFGAEATRARHFARQALIEGDVVSDFFDICDMAIPAPTPPTKRFNQADHIEQSALMLIFILQVLKSKRPVNPRYLPAINSVIGGFGHRRADLADETADDLAQRHAQDLRQAEASINASLMAKVPKAHIHIRHLQDLYDFGHAQLADLHRHLNTKWGLDLAPQRDVTGLAEQALKTIAGPDLSALNRLPAGFNADRYLGNNPDVAHSGVDPIRHYRVHGFFEGRLL